MDMSKTNSILQLYNIRFVFVLKRNEKKKSHLRERDPMFACWNIREDSKLQLHAWKFKLIRAQERKWRFSMTVAHRSDFQFFTLKKKNLRTIDCFI